MGAQGDISKMFYMVRVTKEEEMMQLFVWKFKGEDKLRTFCMTRLVMGNKPSTNISIVAVQQSTELEDFPTSEPEACKVLKENIYVDNVFVTSPDLETLLRNIQVKFLMVRNSCLCKGMMKLRRPWVSIGVW